jgi:protoporphyrinogen oxidase
MNAWTNPSAHSGIPSKAEHWGIVGGGMLGMTLAHRLAQQGKRVTLFEAASHLGGLASTWSLGGIVWDRHYHVISLSDRRLRTLLNELGLERDLRWAETRTGFYHGGKLYSMSNTWEFLRFPPLGLLSKLRLGATIFYASKVKGWKRLEQIPVTVWLQRWSGRQTLEKIWLPLLRAKLGDNHKKTSAAFIWATISRMYAARRSGLKKEMFGYIDGGYARILERFEETLAAEEVSVRPDHSVTRVGHIGLGKVGVTFENGNQEEFDQVVLTVPAPVVARVCVGLTQEETRRLEEVQYQGIICASLLLKNPLSNFYVTNLTDSGLPFTAVIEMSALVDRRYFGGNSLVYLPKYVSADDPAFGVSDSDFKEMFVTALERMYPHFNRKELISFRISRARRVFAISTLNYSTRIPRMTSSIPGVHIVNSAHILNATLNVNETIQLAEQAAERLLSSPVQPSSNSISSTHEYDEAHSEFVTRP